MSQISVAEFQALIDSELPLVKLFGMRTEDMAHGTARLRMHFNPDLIRPGGTIAGPALMALADATLYAVVLAAIAAAALLSGEFNRRGESGRISLTIPPKGSKPVMLRAKAEVNLSDTIVGMDGGEPLRLRVRNLAMPDPADDPEQVQVDTPPPQPNPDGSTGNEFH